MSFDDSVAVKSSHNCARSLMDANEASLTYLRRAWGSYSHPKVGEVVFELLDGEQLDGVRRRLTA